MSGYPGDVLQEVVTTAVEKSKEPSENSETPLSYRERALELVRQKPVLLDPEALKADIFESDEELEEFIEDTYKYRRSFKA